MGKAKPKSKPAGNTEEKTTDLRANRVTIEDADGKPGIVLDASNGDSTVKLYASPTRMIQLIAAKDGRLAVELLDTKTGARVELSMSAGGESSFSIFDSKGRPGAILGLDPNSGAHRLNLFQNGELLWRTPAGDGWAETRVLEALGFSAAPKRSKKAKKPAGT